MGLAKNIVGAGFSWVQAQNSDWAAVNTGIAAAGTTLATATALTACINLVNSGAATAGVKLYDGVINDSQIVYNDNIGNTIIVYPPTSSEQINQLAVGSGINLAPNVTAEFLKVTKTRWICQLSA